MDDGVTDRMRRPLEALEFPPEVLGLILNLLPSTTVISLWKCGTKLLNKRIASSHGLNMRFEDRSSFSWSRYPKMLNALSHLTVLEIIRPYSYVMRAPDLYRCLVALPSTLKTVKFDFLGAKTSLLNLSSPILQFRSNGQILGVKTDTPFGTSYIWDVSSIWNQLEVLSLFDSAALPMQLTVADLSRLPPTLTHFEGGFYKAGTCSLADYIGALPRELKFLHLSGSGTLDPATLKALPPNLTFIGGFTFANVEHLKALPLTLEAIRTGSIKVALTPSQVGILPSLTSLEIEDLNVDLSPLSTTLKHLSILRQTIRMGNLNPDQIRRLPRSLQSFTSYHSLDLTLLERATIAEKTEFWPPRLQHLDILLTTGPTEYLPRSLTLLKKSELGNSRFTPHLLSKLPTSLRTLSMTIGPEAFSKAPIFPTHSLTDLTCSNWRLEWCPSLPETLLALYLGITPYKSDTQNIRFMGFPKNLTRLALALPEERNLVPESASHLSVLKDLKELRLGFNILCKGSIAAHLPRGLVRLALPVDTFSEDDVRQLPRSLATFEAMGGLKTASASLAKYWPPFCLSPTIRQHGGATESSVLELEEAIFAMRSTVLSYQSQYPDPRLLASLES